MVYLCYRDDMAIRSCSFFFFMHNCFISLLSKIISFANTSQLSEDLNMSKFATPSAKTSKQDQPRRKAIHLQKHVYTVHQNYSGCVSFGAPHFLLRGLTFYRVFACFQIYDIKGSF